MDRRKKKLHRAVGIHGFSWGLARTMGAVAMGLLVVLGVGIGYEHTSDTWSARKYPAPGKAVLVDGHALHLYCQGEGHPTVLFEAAPGEWSLHWTPVQERVAKFTRACAYDRAGYGWSEVGPPPRNADRVAEELSILLAGDDFPGPVVLVAHSLSGFSARIAAARDPERISALVLVDAVPDDMVGLFAQSLKPLRTRFRQALSASHFGLTRLTGAPAGLPRPPRNEPFAWPYPSQSVRSAFFETYLSETDDLLADAAQAGRAELPDGLPLVVLFRAEPVALGGMAHERYSALWAMQQGVLAGLSRRGQWMPVSEPAGHLPLDEADEVTNAIRAAIIQTLSRPPDRTGIPDRPLSGHRPGG